MDFGRFKGQAHEGDADLVMHAGVDDGLAGFGQIVDVVHEIEVTVDAGAVLLHQLRLEAERLEPLRGECHAGNGTSQDLQIHVGSDLLADRRHAFEGIFTNVEIRGLESCAAAEFEMADPHAQVDSQHSTR